MNLKYTDISFIRYSSVIHHCYFVLKTACGRVSTEYDHFRKNTFCVIWYDIL